MARTLSSPVRRIGPILVVDDYDDARATVCEALENAGYRVTEARNGQQALDLLAGHPDERPALIVLDLQMPIMNGWDLLEVMKCYVSLSSIPVVIVTGQDPRPERLHHQGIVACIQAPYRLEDLVATIDTCLAEGRRPITATRGAKDETG